jgi:hypothetical protein
MIEMTVAMIIFAIVLASIYGLLEVGRSARLNSMQSTETSQDARVGLNTMGKDVLNAGVDYPGAGSLLRTNWLTSNLSLPVGAVNLTPVIAGYQVNRLTNTQVSPSTITLTDQITLTLTDNTFHVVSGLTTPLNISAMNTARSWLTCLSANDASFCNLGDLISVFSPNNGNGVVALVTGKTTNVLSNDTLVVAATDPMGINDLSLTPSNMAAVAAPAGASRISMVTYYVLDDGSGQGTGTLMRRTWGGVDSSGNVIRFLDQPLAFDVTGMIIQYYLQNGQIKPNPAVTEFQNIRQLSVTLTVRSPKRDPKTGLSYIDTLTTVFNTRNLGYETNG